MTMPSTGIPLEGGGVVTMTMIGLDSSVPPAGVDARATSWYRASLVMFHDTLVIEEGLVVLPTMVA